MKRLTTSILAAAALASALSAQGFPRVRVPLGNPVTPDKILLGQALFFEEQMSAQRTMACATCHIFSAGGGSDPRSFEPESIHPGRDGRVGTADDVRGSMGVRRANGSGSYTFSDDFAYRTQVTRRRAGTVINAAFDRFLFWDGRATPTFRGPLTGTVVLGDDAALESQAALPPTDDVEMCNVGEDWNDVVERIRNARPLALASDVPPRLASFIANKSYPDLFAQVFGASGTRTVSANRIIMAIATYERTLISNQSRFDDFQRGNFNALSASERRGFELFRQRCDGCHAGPLQTDHQFHNTGVRPIVEDAGRQEVTRQFEDRGRFKTPGLRNIELRAPYFHNGEARTLMEVVNFYNRGGNFNENKDRRVRRLGWNQGQRQDVVNFMLALTDPRVRNETGPFERPTLYSESNRMPTLYGTATAGARGAEPVMIAEQPFFIGSPGNTIGITRGLRDAPAILGLDGIRNQSGFMLNGARIHLALSAGLIVVPHGALNNRGQGSLTFRIPNDVALRGLPVHGQWLVGEANGSFSATQAFATRIF